MAASRPRLTDRQTAVRAAVERLRRPVMADLWQEFPDLAPSAIKKVLDSLRKKGLVASAGDESQAYPVAPASQVGTREPPSIGGPSA